MSDIKPQFKLRSKTGCITCRIRKVKCDETRPACQKCTTTGRKCDGYAPPGTTTRSRSSSRQPTISRSSTPRPPIPAKVSLILPLFDNDLERHFFGFFVNCTAFVSPLYYGNAFWAQRVLRMSLTEPAIRNAVCSLSALHRSMCSSGDKTRTEAEKDARNHALLQYNKAVSNACRLVAESLNGSNEKLIQGLVACVLFICYENLMGNSAMAQTHLQHGLKIIEKSAPGSIPDDIIHVFQRLDFQAMAYPDATAPYSYGTAEDVVIFDSIDKELENFDDAMSKLIQTARWVFRRTAEVHPRAVPIDEADGALQALRRWRVSFDRMLSQHELEGDPQLLKKQESTITTLNLFWYGVYVILETGRYGRECANDMFDWAYQEMVNISEKLFASKKEANEKVGTTGSLFSLEMGIVMFLFYAAVKCRERSIRRRAIRLLQSENLREGPWQSYCAGKVAQLVMEIEEENARGKESIEEADRILVVSSHRDLVTRRLKVTCLLRSYVGKTMEDSKWYSEDREIPLCSL